MYSVFQIHQLRVADTHCQRELPKPELTWPCLTFSSEFCLNVVSKPNKHINILIVECFICCKIVASTPRFITILTLFSQVKLMNAKQKTAGDRSSQIQPYTLGHVLWMLLQVALPMHLDPCLQNFSSSRCGHV